MIETLSSFSFLISSTTIHHWKRIRRRKIRAKNTKERRRRVGNFHLPEGNDGGVVMAEIEMEAVAEGSDVARVSDWENEMRELLKASDWDGIVKAPSKSDAMAGAPSYCSMDKIFGGATSLSQLGGHYNFPYLIVFEWYLGPRAQHVNFFGSVVLKKWQ